MPKLIKGVQLELGGETFECAPLALGDLELMQERLEAFQSSGSSIDRESIRTVIDAVLAALRRNYPDMTRERVGAIVDVGNMHSAMLAVMGVSGMQERGEPGEAPPVSTGDGSMPTSPSAPAGQSTTSEST